MTDALLDELYDLLFLGPEGPLVGSRMLLKPDRGAESHFITAPRPGLTREDMARGGGDGLLAELARLLDELPSDRRAEVIDRVAAIIGVLRAEAGDPTDAEPPSLTYTFH